MPDPRACRQGRHSRCPRLRRRRSRCRVPPPPRRPPPAVPVPSVPATPAGPSWPVTDAIKYAAAIKANNALTGKGPWKESTADKEAVKAFQRNEGLTAAGLWGAGAGIHMGTNYGIVPVKPFYWPKDTKKVPAKKAEWRAAMMALAAKDPMRSAEWTAAANV